MALNSGFIAPDLYQNYIEVDRQVLQLLAGEQPGVTSPDAFAVTAGSGLSVNVAAGKAFVDGKNIPALQGFYYAMSDGEINVAIPAAAAQGRIDRVILAVRDSQYGALPESKEQGAEIFVVAGTPSTTPVPQNDAEVQSAVGPGGWIELAQVRVNGGASSLTPGSITDKRLFVGGPGYTQGTTAARPSQASPGSRYYATDTNTMWLQTSIGWQRPQLPIEIPSNANLNTYITSGTYTQSQNKEADAGTNYPPAPAAFNDETQAGLLEVFRNPEGSIVWQRYTEYHRDFVIWERHFYSGSWSPWFPIGGPGDWSLTPVTNRDNVSDLSPILGSPYRGVNRAGRIAFQFKWTGPTLTADSRGNFADQELFTISNPAYRPPRDTDVPIVQSGVATCWGRMNASGGVNLTHASFPNQLFENGVVYRINYQWLPT